MMPLKSRRKPLFVGFADSILDGSHDCRVRFVAEHLAPNPRGLGFAFPGALSPFLLILDHVIVGHWDRIMIVPEAIRPSWLMRLPHDLGSALPSALVLGHLGLDRLVPRVERLRFLVGGVSDALERGILAALAAIPRIPAPIMAITPRAILGVLLVAIAQGDGLGSFGAGEHATVEIHISRLQPEQDGREALALLPQI